MSLQEPSGMSCSVEPPSLQLIGRLEDVSNTQWEENIQPIYDMTGRKRGHGSCRSRQEVGSIRRGSRDPI